jgi:hypothetical protein
VGESLPAVRAFFHAFSARIAQYQRLDLLRLLAALDGDAEIVAKAG